MVRRKIKKKAKKKAKPGEADLKNSARMRKVANAPLKKKGTSDAWNERQNRLAASKDSAKLLVRGIIKKNKAKRKAKKKAKTKRKK